MRFNAFANESQVVGIGDIEVENRLDKVSIHGSLDITKDAQGLQDALALKALVDCIVDELKRSDLPESITNDTPVPVRNPFS